MAQSQLHPPTPELTVRYPVPRWTPAWAVPEVPVPESDTHDAAIEWLRALLLAWAERAGRDIKVARNLGIRWVREEPRAGFDPDLCLIEPAPDRTQPLSSLRLWLPEHVPPLLAIEVVSPGHPYKDYIDTPERCAACGVRELWIYDPMLEGPRSRGGPQLLQVWRRPESGGFERIHAGAGAAFSPALQAWLHPEPSRLPSGARLDISSDAAGRERWLSNEERARLGEQRARAERERARANEQHARANEQHARANEQQARTCLEQEQRERAELERRVRALEEERARNAR
jgi:Uma2 family endonuclease